MRHWARNPFRRFGASLTLVASFVLLQQAGCEKGTGKHTAWATSPGLASRLPECVATPPDSGWQEVTLATFGRMHLPQDARSVTGPAGHESWMLGDYGGIGYTFRSEDSSSIPKIISDSSAGVNGWCLGHGGSAPFLARVVVGHLYASFGRHVEAHWALGDSRELVVSGMTDTAAGNVLLQIVRTEHLRE